ncbi:MAG: hypothetical protein IPL33_00815 [Sphingobacteriales bacterium]|nr:hypothetical protein [Sphingobacteriales bacterium]
MKTQLFLFRIALVLLLLTSLSTAFAHPACSSPLLLPDLNADNSRSDTIDVLHYDISLRLTQLTSTAELIGECEVSLLPRINDLAQVLLDLQDLNITGVEVNGIPAEFSHTNALLRVNLLSPANVSDTLRVRVQYHGNPPTAVFGGFYFAADHAYNLGVGIGIDPPSYGRAWFPCVDNFVERSTYSFHITTNPNRKAFCNGVLEGSTDNADDTKTWHWNMYQSIPTYLASVAVSNYQTLEWQHYGIADTILVQLGARAADTSDLRASFVHLPDCISAFENAFGAYSFDRIGFVVVPFSGGAMEHATNIAYPSFAVNGNLDWESLMSHEFAHHWFGNLVTCETPADMWLNEGWASYAAHYFTEAVYGKQRYLDEVRNNHDRVLTLAHINDGSYLPVAGVPFEATYGEHVYNKGADVAHTLRGYMGDTLFFGCLRQYLDAFAFSTANTDQFRDYMSACSGIDLTHFFDDWVKQPGFAHFAVSTYILGVGAPRTDSPDYLIRQRHYANPNLYNNVPLEVSFFDEHFNRHIETVFSGAASCNWYWLSDADYVYIALDFDEKINDASTDYHRFINTTGSYDFPTTRVSVAVNNIVDTTLLRIIHNRIAPDRFDDQGNYAVPDNIKLSPNRYWTVEGYSQSTFDASATFTYNGSTSTGGYLDNNLITGNENNLRLLFRPQVETFAPWNGNWQVVNDAVLETGSSSTDKKGTITVPQLQYGEYALGYDSSTTDTMITPTPCELYIGSNPAIPEQTAHFKAQPNPTTVGNISLVWEEAPKPLSEITVYASNGKMVYSEALPVGATTLNLPANQWQSGVYIICWRENQRGKGCIKVVVQ